MAAVDTLNSPSLPATTTCPPTAFAMTLLVLCLTVPWIEVSIPAMALVSS